MNPILVEVDRSGWVESIHRGTVLLHDANGDVRVLGNPDLLTYPRSSLKPLQATAMVRAGFAGTEAELALGAASHTGSPEHVELARTVLAGAGLTPAALDCPPDLPETRDDLLAHVRAGGGPESLLHNCSGKHSAMLATCVAAGWPTEGYLDPEHPLQRHIFATVAELSDLSPEALGTYGIDGCGAPVPVIPLRALLTAMIRIVTAPVDSPEGQVSAAMRAWPGLVGGPGRASTDLMRACPGLLAKEGAEGVWVAGLPDGRTMVAKIDDGALRALPAVLAATVRSWGFSGPVVDRWEHDPVLGRGNPVGELRPSAELVAFLA